MSQYSTKIKLLTYHLLENVLELYLKWVKPNYQVTVLSGTEIITKIEKVLL